MIAMPAVRKYAADDGWRASCRDCGWHAVCSSKPWRDQLAASHACEQDADAACPDPTTPDAA